MRRTYLTLLAVAALAAVSGVPEAWASNGTVPIELRNGNGRAVITSTRGSVNVLVGLGRIRLVNRAGGHASKFLCNRSPRRVSGVAIEFKGRRVSCLIYGPWRRQVIVKGRRISVSGKARGSLTLDAFNSGRTGTYSIRDRPFRSWPRRARTFSLAG